MSMPKPWVAFCALAVAAVTPAGLLRDTEAVFAHEGAKGIVKQRMDLMEDIKKNMKTITDMARGKTDFDREALAEAAVHVARRAGHIQGMFPKNSLDKPTQARRQIWRDWARFEQLTEKLVATATSLSRSAKNANGRGDIKAAVRSLQATCTDCHDSFRARRR